MKKFMVLYQSALSNEDQMAAGTTEESEAGMAAWMKWKDDAGDAVADFGMPLAPCKHIDRGNVTDSKTEASGYSIIQAESEEEAIELLKDHPHLQMPGGATIELLEFAPMPGM